MTLEQQRALAMASARVRAAEAAQAKSEDAGAPGVIEDLDKAIPHGVVKGVAGWLGGPADAARGVAWAADQIKSKVTGRPYEEIRDEADARAILPSTTLDKMGSQGVQQAIRRYTPKGAEILDYEPKTPVGKFGAALGGVAPAIPLGPAAAVTGAIGSEGAGQVADALTDSPTIRAGARVAGAIAAPSVLRRAVTPIASDPARQPFVERMAQEGVDLSAGDRTGSKALRWAESAAADMPGGAGAAEAAATQGRQFNRAVAGRMGEDADMLTGEVMARANHRIGQAFEDLSARNTLVADRQVVTDLAQARTMHPAGVLDDAAQRAVNAYSQRIGQLFQPAPGGGAAMPGTAYQSLRSELTTAAYNTANNREREVLQALRNALDTGMERSIATTNPADLGAWQTAREQYGAMKNIEGGLTGAGERAAQGYVSPSQLRSVIARRDPTGYVRGENDMGELAKAAEATIKPLPQSGTAPRAYYSALPSAFATMVGGAASGNLPLAAGAAGAIAGPPVASALLRSRAGQAYLGNNIAPAPNRDRVVDALLAAQRAQLGRPQ